MRQMFAKEPAIAERWSREAPVNYKDLPEHVKKVKKSKKAKRKK